MGQRIRRAWTLYLGLAMIVACMALVWLADVPTRQYALVPDTPVADLPAPQTTVQHIARWAAVNITGICWVGYLLALDGLLTLISIGRPDATACNLHEGSPLRHRPNRFLIAWLTSIPVWCFFDWINFYHMQAWDYHGLPPQFPNRLVGYFVAFAAISPGMFLAAELYQRLGTRRFRIDNPQHRRHVLLTLSLGVILLIVAIIMLLGLVQQRGPSFMLGTLWLVLPGLAVLVVTRKLEPSLVAFGASMTLWAVAVSDPIGNMALWVGLIYLLDPLAGWMGGPSIISDWRAGRLGRTASLMMGGATCGLLWEMWNYWAIAKWTYNLPFLGEWEAVRYFEMPVIGFIGFLPFAIECWVMLSTIIALLTRMQLRLAEPLPDKHAVL